MTELATIHTTITADNQLISKGSSTGLAMKNAKKKPILYSLIFFIVYYGAILIFLYLLHAKQHLELPVEDIIRLDLLGGEFESVKEPFFPFPWSNLEILIIPMSDSVVPKEEIELWLPQVVNLIDKISDRISLNGSIEIQSSIHHLHFADIVGSSKQQQHDNINIIYASDILSTMESWNLEPNGFGLDSNIHLTANCKMFVFYPKTSGKTMIMDSNGILTNHVFIPALGGLTIVNNDNEDDLLSVLYGQLATLIDVDHSFFDPSDIGLVNSMTRKIHLFLKTTARVLKNTAKLVSEVDNLVIESRHVNLVKSSMESYHIALDSLKKFNVSGDLIDLHKSMSYSIKALDYAQNCWSDPGMLGFLHLPHLQQLAIYLPLSIPLMSSLFSGIISYLENSSKFSQISQIRKFTKSKNGKRMYYAISILLCLYLWTFHRNTIATLFELDDWKVDEQVSTLT